LLARFGLLLFELRRREVQKCWSATISRALDSAHAVYSRWAACRSRC
jgi:hypothetical protein